MWRLSINIELGKDEPHEPDREGGADALTERADSHDRPPIGFYPASDPTRRAEDNW